MEGEIWQRVKELSARLSISVNLRKSIETLSYQRPGERQVSYVPVRLGVGPLNRAQEMVSAVARVTGLAEDAVVSHMLIGQPLKLPAVRGHVARRTGRLPDNDWWDELYATIEINVRDVSYAELRSLYHALRRTWRRARTGGLTERDEWLLKTVEKLGGVPAQQPWSRKFWERVHELARRAGYEDESWRTSLMQYRRLTDKLRATPRLGRGKLRSPRRA